MRRVALASLVSIILLLGPSASSDPRDIVPCAAPVGVPLLVFSMYVTNCIEEGPGYKRHVCYRPCDSYSCLNWSCVVNP